MRIIAPAERTDAVRELPVAAPGATHVAVLAGVAVHAVLLIWRRSHPHGGSRRLSAG